ncbi:uncharacterized protein LOC129741119 [Uranotaenia lowii]|uniref:uncharacterized protein LOC129741119 n=1 Tax=Uranotaenia lowii TaxID=190385 RepID=UPI002478E425|nr:uncharacterized protein LOC129741119 [Uranotaenia lowii]
MPSELRELIKQDRNLRRTLDSVRQFASSESNNSELISVRLELLESTFEQFKKVRTEIELQTDHLSASTIELSEQTALDQAREEENVGILVEFEEDYCVVKSELRRQLSAIKASTNATPAPSAAESFGPPSTLARVKLPEIKLPIFSGKSKEWVTFRDSFKSLIHSSNQLNDTDKFCYLRSAVTGEALQAIASVDITAANYDIAWSTLEKRYENRKLLVKSYLDSLFSIEPMRKESYDSLNMLLSEFERNLQMLQKVGENPGQWSTLLVHMLCSRLDQSTLRQWETHHCSKEVPLYDDLMCFLRNHCSMLESIAHRRPERPESSEQRFKFGVSNPAVPSQIMCPFCGDMFHIAFRCTKFLKQTVGERSESVKRARLCYNCLSSGHLARDCVKGYCHHCGMRHHSLLHPISSVSQQSTRHTPSVSQPRRHSPSSSHTSPISNQPTPSHPPNTQPSTSYPVTQPILTTDPQQTIALPSHTPNLTKQVLLSTAIVRIQDSLGNTRLARALIDSCSQFCFMTTRFSQQLKLRHVPENLTVQGIGGSRAMSRKLVVASVRARTSLISAFNAQMSFFILPELTATLPAKRVEYESWRLPHNVQLADPSFSEPGEIDMIIGAEQFFDLLLEGRFKLSNDGPSLQNSVFGWIVAGTIPNKSASCSPSSVTCSVAEIQEQLTKFWELESCRSTSTQSVEESTCEELFAETTTRDCDGKFVVSLPKRDHVIRQLGESRNVALRRFFSVEKQFESNSEKKSAYTAFMEEYISLGHMREVSNPDEASPVYYLPHHAVYKPDSSTTKLRVVFDASCKTTTGVSLNDGLLVGPVVQEDLLSIVLRFRLHRVAVVTDVEKMYRMVKVQAEDQRLQRILWRESPEIPVRTYELVTVTYGTACAPYLATKCLQQLADSGKESYPEAARSLQYDTYVDDSLTGANSVDSAIKLAKEMIELAAAGGFLLRKFNSNSADVLSAIPDHLIDERASLNLDSSTAAVKTLGLVWKPATDCFVYDCPVWSDKAKITKRVVLAETARLFDPIGLVGPVVVIAKIFLQDLWKLQCGWDDSLPEEMQNFWQEYRMNLKALSSLSVPRWLTFHSEASFVEIHGFCDASEKAYGACVYLRCTAENGEVTVRLITAKSRVAPLDDLKRKKKKQTIPRLELSSALLLAHLYEKVKRSLRIAHSAEFWTDSTIVICWLSSLPSRWQAFVSNRVSEIQHTTKGCQWHHVAGVENPADIISRGMMIRFDEMNTISIQIEAILNSRPLTPMTNDPADYEAITPGHFLIHRPLTAVPEPSKEHIPENHLSRWQRTEVFYERIWKRWSSQYLSDLHNRTKWTRKRNNIAVGTMVLLKEDNLPPLQWALGRVTKIYPGPDGNIRVVDVKTKDSQFQRGIQKICVLPIKDNIDPAGELNSPPPTPVYNISLVVHRIRPFLPFHCDDPVVSSISQLYLAVIVS